MQAPRPIGTPSHNVSISGNVFPWHQGKPTLLTMLGTLETYLPVFTTVSKLQGFMAEMSVPFQSIKRIDDQLGFLDTLPEEFHVIIDPYFMQNGCVRFIEVMR